MIKRRSGFSLPEVLVTLVIISLVMAATVPIVMKSKSSPAEAPWKYVTKGELVQNASVYSAIGDASTVVVGDNVVPIQYNITDKNNVFGTRLNPKLSIIGRTGADNPLISRHLIDFYEKGDTNNQYVSIGKVSFDRFFNLAVGMNALDAISTNDTGDYQKAAGLESSTATDSAWTSALNEPDDSGVFSSEVKAAFNTAVGQYSMAGNEKILSKDDGTKRTISGSGNTALGAFALRRNTSGNLNTAIGLKALEAMGTDSATGGSGSYNVAVGAFSLYNNLSGQSNVSVGKSSLSKLTEGNDNISIGTDALKNNQTGSGQTAIGTFALSNSTIAIPSAGDSAAFYQAYQAANTAIGYRSLEALSSGSTNVAIGSFSMPQSNGNKNIIIGNSAMYSATSGESNIVIGHSSCTNGDNWGNNNIVIGNGINSTSPDVNGKKLYIEGDAANYNMENALIYGDFSNDKRALTLNAKELTLGVDIDDAKIDIGTEKTTTTLNGTLSFAEGSKAGGTVEFDNIAFTGTIDASESKITVKTPSAGSDDIVTVSYMEDYVADQIAASISAGGGGAVSDAGFKAVKIASFIPERGIGEVSDARLKNIIGDNNAGLKEIAQLKIKNFTMKNDKKKELMVGVIAQELQKVFPNSVVTGRDGYLRIKRDEIFYACVNAIKELNTMVQDIIAKITGLEEKIRLLEDRNKINEEKIALLEKQNKLFEERLTALESSNKVQKPVDKKAEKKAEKAETAVKTDDVKAETSEAKTDKTEKVKANEKTEAKPEKSDVKSDKAEVKTEKTEKAESTTKK